MKNKAIKLLNKIIKNNKINKIIFKIMICQKSYQIKAKTRTQKSLKLLQR